MEPLRDFQIRHLAAIVQSSDDAIVSKDLNGIVQSWNAAAERMFGYSPVEAIGRPITLIIPPDRLAEEDEILSRIRRGDGVDHFETWRRRKDGILIPVSLTISPVRDDNGAIIGASKIARDISERRRAEQLQAERAELQRRLSMLVDASGTLLASLKLADVMPAVLRVARELIQADAYAVWRFDDHANGWRIGAADGLSRAFHQFVAQSGDEPSGLALDKPLPVTDVAGMPMLASRRDLYAAEGIRSLLVVPLVIGGRRTGTFVIYHKQPHQYSFVEVQVASALGNLAASAIRTGELYDEQRHSRDREAFLAAAGTTLTSSLDLHETLRALANLAVPAIADWCTVDILNEDGTVERVAVSHKDPEKIELVRRYRDRLPPSPDSPYRVENVIRAGEPVFLERISEDVLLAAGYTPEHIEAIEALGLRSFICSPLVSHGRTLGAVTFVGAESGRRYTEADLPFIVAVANRAALAIENARAYQSVQEANRLKDDFLGTLSHELRTPLNAIMGYTRMMRSGLMQGDQVWRALEVVERNAVALNQIVGDVLDIARITSGKLHLSMEAIDLRQVVENAVATVMPAATARGVRIALAMPDPAIVSGDPARLQQVVWNLLTNAVKFTDRGGSVEVITSRHDGVAELVVSDTGQGIVPEFLPHIFERFRQADGGFAREHGGLGLGLAICRQLLEMHGGTITAASDGPGQGATFSVRLPLLVTEHESADDGTTRPDRVTAIATRERPAPAAEWVAGALRDLSILVLDDDADARSLLQTLLISAGARPLPAASGVAALQILSETVPDLLLVDIGMPGMDGFDFIRRVRREERLARIPAAALTAYTRPEDRARVLTSGFQIHLAKPVDPVELLASLAALAGRVRSPLEQA